MGVIIGYTCEKCGFTINDQGLKYFVDEKTNCVIEHFSGKLTFDAGKDSKIKGRIILSFCSDCSSEVHFYYNENEYYVEEIRFNLEQNKENYNDILNEKNLYREIFSVRDFIDQKFRKKPIPTGSLILRGVIGSIDKTHEKCPKCGKDIPLIMKDNCECPKCGEKLHSQVIALYD